MMMLRDRWRALRAVGQRVWSVLREGSPGFLLVAGFALALVVGWSFRSDMAAAIRYAAAVLQVLGLLLVAHGLHKTRATFGRPTIAARIREWFDRLLTSGRPRNIVIAVGAGEIKLSGLAALAHGSVSGGTIERRVEMLEADIRALRKEVGESAAKTRDEIAGLKSELSAEVTRRTENDARVENLLAEVAVGGLHLEWIGLVWLVAATVLSAFPDELAGLF